MADKSHLLSIEYEGQIVAYIDEKRDYLLALLCRSLCSCLVRTLRFPGLLFLGLRSMWCITKLLGGCFCPVLPDLNPLRFISSCFSPSDNKPICPPPFEACKWGLGRHTHTPTKRSGRLLLLPPAGVSLHPTPIISPPRNLSTSLCKIKWWGRIRLCGGHLRTTLLNWVSGGGW